LRSGVPFVYIEITKTIEKREKQGAEKQKPKWEILDRVNKSNRSKNIS